MHEILAFIDFWGSDFALNNIALICRGRALFCHRRAKTLNGSAQISAYITQTFGTENDRHDG